MRLVTLQKMTIHTPQSDQIKFFLDEVDALAYKKINEVTHPISLESHMALQSDNAYCLVAEITEYRSNASLKTKDRIYTVTQRDGYITLGNEVTTLIGEGHCIYLSLGDQLYFLRDSVPVEAQRGEIQAIKPGFSNAVAAARNHIAAEQRQARQPSWFQMWQRPSFHQPFGWQVPPPSNDDPMDIEKPTVGYDYFGVTGS